MGNKQENNWVQPLLYVLTGGLIIGILIPNFISFRNNRRLSSQELAIKVRVDSIAEQDSIKHSFFKDTAVYYLDKSNKLKEVEAELKNLKAKYDNLVKNSIDVSNNIKEKKKILNEMDDNVKKAEDELRKMQARANDNNLVSDALFAAQRKGIERFKEKNKLLRKENKERIERINEAPCR